MHRHSYKGRKFGRETDQRLALRRALVCSLIREQSITTTLARAKEIRRITEKLVTIAKKGGLANRRLVISRLNDIETANLLMDVVAPQITRNSGYLKIEKAGFRRGDNAEMGTISFVDEIDFEKFAKPEKKESKKVVAKAEKPAKAAKTAKKEEK
ncbi:50S ribosomal protein L17 [Candidatus Saccharibacteria bacterium]|nr:50S ribosomal protein L17 [Candidatus Saccharibacteria bacterium]